VLVVDIPESQQIERVCRRDDISEQQARAILKAQVSRQQRLAAADDIIDNSGIPEALREQVQALHLMYLALADRA
jgi:dephospho-CoA kinase